MIQDNKVLWILVIAAAVLVTGRQHTAGDGDRHAAGADPILVELFTSQGCSSCPPADRLLSRLSAAAQGGETAVIPLSFHVDYWNYIGWTDPFSSAEWSERQRSYAESFDSGRVYTPQLVVNGRRDCVGSNEQRVREEIERAERQRANGRLELELSPGGWGRDGASRRRLPEARADRPRLRPRIPAGFKALALNARIVSWTGEKAISEAAAPRRRVLAARAAPRPRAGSRACTDSSPRRHGPTRH